MNWHHALVVTVVIQALALAGLCFQLLLIRSIDLIRDRHYRPLHSQFLHEVRRWSLGEGEVGDVVLALRRLGGARAIKALAWTSLRASGDAWEDLVRAIEREPWVIRARRNSRSRRWWARRQCATLLSVTAVPDDTREAIRLLRDPHPAVSIAIMPVFERLQSEELEAAVLGKLKDLSPVLLAYYAWTIRRTGTGIARPLVDLLRAAEGPEAVRLAEFGVHLADPVLRPAFIALAGHADPEIRARSARALGRMPGEDVRPVLESLVRDEAWQVRLHAVRSLGRIASHASLDVLSAALHDPIHWVRLRAGKALARLGEPGRQVLARTAAGGDAEARDVARLLLSLPSWSVEDVAA